jgi:hypothetical protein
MVEGIAKQLTKLQLEVQSLQAQIQGRVSGIKDMSVVSLVPKCSGEEKGTSLNVFLEADERAARLGNWSDQDKVQVAILRLHENARVFFLTVRWTYRVQKLHGRVSKRLYERGTGTYIRTSIIIHSYRRRNSVVTKISRNSQTGVGR